VLAGELLMDDETVAVPAVEPRRRDVVGVREEVGTAR
jgi:hypothetical protein